MAREAVATYGLPREVEPEEALREEIWRTAGAVDFLQERVRELQPEALTWGDVARKHVDGEGGWSETKEAARPSIWVILYQQERRHLVDVCRVAIAAGLAEREVKLAEEQGRLIAKVMKGVLAELGVDQHPDVASVVRRHLTMISGGMDADHAG